MTLFDKLLVFRRLVSNVVFDCSRDSFLDRLHYSVSSFNDIHDFCFIDTHNKQYYNAHFYLADVIEVRNYHNSIIIDVFICFCDNLRSNIYYRVDV